MEFEEAQQLLHVDDFLDFSNDDVFDASSSDTSSLPEPSLTSRNPSELSDSIPNLTNFDELCIPIEDAEELEWLSRFVEDSFSYMPFPDGKNDNGENLISPLSGSIPAAAKSKRSRPAGTSSGWMTVPAPAPSQALAMPEAVGGRARTGAGRRKEAAAASGEAGVRRCTHCAAEKTPQWRTGPMGPKSLCNACGVRYKSGRLVPEYRPAASPTFVLTQHSNSHRKVIELRRQKEVLRRDKFHDFKSC